MKLIVLTTMIASCLNCTAQLPDRSTKQYNVQVGDTIYKYNLFSSTKWEGYIVESKDDSNLITARSFDGGKTIQPYQRREQYDSGTYKEKTYVGKDELIRYLSMSPEFTFKMTQVKKKIGKSVLDVTKNANINLCGFSDNAIDIQWHWGDNKYYGLSLKNKSGIETITIDWNDAIYVDMDGNAVPIINASNIGNNERPSPTKILEGTKISVKLIPECCITKSGSQITYEMALRKYIDSNCNSVRISLPIKIKGIITRYDFYFKIGMISELEYLKKNGIIII